MNQKKKKWFAALLAAIMALNILTASAANFSGSSEVGGNGEAASALPDDAPMAIDDGDGEDPSDDVEGYWNVRLSFVKLNQTDNSYDRVDDPETHSHQTVYKSGFLDCLEFKDFTEILQITFENTHLLYDYDIGEVSITVLNPFYSGLCTQAQIEVKGISTSAGAGDAEDGEQSKSHWELDNPENKPLADLEYFTFKNTVKFDKNETFAGSIQINFQIQSIRELHSQEPGISNPKVERFTDECFHYTDKAHIEAVLHAKAEKAGDTRPEGVTTTSNYIDYHFERSYEHPWQRYTNLIEKRPLKISFQDEFKKYFDVSDEVFDSHYWVRWDIAIDATDEMMALVHDDKFYFNDDLYIFNKSLRAYDDFPSDCLVFGEDGSRLQPDAWKDPEPPVESGYDRYAYEFDLPYYENQTVVRQELDENGYYHWYVVVGYPKEYYGINPSEVAEGKKPIENTAYLYGEPIDQAGNRYQDEGPADMSEMDFDFEYHGELYYVGKESTSEDTKYYQDITGQRSLNGNFTYNLIAVALYAKFPEGTRHPWHSEHDCEKVHPDDPDARPPYDDGRIDYTSDLRYGMDVVIGDDYLYISDQEDDYRPLEDHEYYFSKIHFPETIYNTSGAITNQYKVELYVRYANTTEYALYSTFYTTDGAEQKQFHFSAEEEPKVVGYYFVIRNMRESLAGNLEWYTDADGNSRYYIVDNANIFTNEVVIKAAMADQTKEDEGRIYNFDYLKVYQEEMRPGDLSQGWVNQPEESSYAQGSGLDTRGKIAPRDQDEHGGYVQRAVADDPYEDAANFSIKQSTRIQKYMNLSSGDAYSPDKRGWTGTATLSAFINGDIRANYSSDQLSAAELKYLPEGKWCTGWEIHDVLPEYMDLDSTVDEIKASFDICSKMWNPGYSTIYQKNASSVTTISSTTLRNNIKAGTDIVIEEDFQHTGRTAIHIYIRLPQPILMVAREASYGLSPSNLRCGEATHADGSRHHGDFQFMYNFIYRLEGYWEKSATARNAAVIGFLDRKGIPNIYDDNGKLNPYFEDYPFYDPTNPFILGANPTPNRVYNKDAETAENSSYNTYAVHDWLDWDNDGDLQEWFASMRTSATVSLPSGSWQSVVKKVAAEDESGKLGEFTTNRVAALLEGQYQYSITIRIGHSFLDDIILYDNVESYYQTPLGPMDETGSAWKGTFVGVDTTSGTSGLPGLDRIDVYWSSALDAGALYETVSPDISDPSNILTMGRNPQWHPLSELEDPSVVHSLAFEFIKAEGDNHTLKSDEEATVFITMQAPAIGNTNPDIDPSDYFAHNGAWTSWIANDENGNKLGDNLGLPSNTVKVVLPESTPPDKELPSTGSSELLLLCAAAAVLAAAGIGIRPRRKRQAR